MPSPHLITEIGKQLLITRYFIIATLAIIIYEYFITLGDEIRYMWPARRSIMKFAFFLNRYMPLVSVGDLSYAIILGRQDGHCKLSFIIFGSMVQANLIVSEFILHYRAYAVWGCPRKLLVALSLVFLSTMCVSTYYATVTLKSFKTYAFPLYSRGCIANPDEEYIWNTLIVFIVAETFSLVVVMLKAYRLRGSQLMKVIFKDGTIFYFVILVTFIMTTIISRSKLIALRNLLITLQASLHSIFCSRMLLHIRAKYDKLSSVPRATSDIANHVPLNENTFATSASIGFCSINRRNNDSCDGSSSYASSSSLRCGMESQRNTRSTFMSETSTLAVISEPTSETRAEVEEVTIPNVPYQSLDIRAFTSIAAV